MRETCEIEKVYVACRILGAETDSAPKEKEAKLQKQELPGKLSK
jgi:hypothetical protein